KNLANPLACIMSGVMMLNHIGQEPAADRIKAAYNTVLTHGNPEDLTPDIGGSGTTTDFTDAVIARIG
ncbi:MAG: isocitrate/isopropylmalate family dehydrogenase, partial [Kiloniellaceae bacterium]